MESSEDDAGTATNASRRDSAREKAVGLSEDINATSCSLQGSSEVQPSCETPAMSEDNFDGDSVPSPSAQDVNTSTEAILDMIDEIVDGPGAPKRLPLALESVDSPNEPVATTSEHPEVIQESVKNCDDFLQASPPVASVLDNINSEILLPTRINEPAEPSNHSCEVSEVNVTETIPGGSLPQNAETANSSQAEVSVPSNAVTEPPAPCPPPNIPTSSEEQSVQNIYNISECKTQERTVKCVTSSDSRDNVTVESAESTSSDSSVSEGKPILVETLTRSPLKRRLVRPAPSDRRPDSTVSSTVDSQIVNIPTADQSSCENIAKDVTSSSDAVSTLDCNDKPEEIRNVSEINFCKAETSVSPPKKIKLIRQKNISGNSNVDCTPAQTTASAENLQCQSTSSSDSHMVPTEEPKTESSKSISIQQESDITEKSSSNCVLEENTIKNSDISTLSSGEQSQPDIAPINPVETTEKVHQKVTEGSQPEVLHDLSDLGNISEAIQGSNNLPATSSSNTQEDSNLGKPRSPQPTADIVVNIEQNEISHGEHEEPKLENEPEPAEQKIAPSQDSHTASSTSSENESENSSKTPEDQKRVPPIKLNLSMSNLSESKLDSDTSSINKHHVNDESESAKQVPKLTIKLKQSDEAKSPVPKLTIKPIKPPSEQDVEDKDGNQQFTSVTKINIKPIPKPSDNINERLTRSQKESNEDAKLKVGEQLPSITKLNIKPIMKPPEKINDIHRKSSSSEISESEYSENDESTSTSDQASVSDQGPSDVVPKVTIKLGKPGTESEGKFYTEQNAPKLTIKGIQQHEQEEQEPKLKLVISQSEDKQTEKIPKLTIKTVTKSESQPLSPKLTIKPLKPPDANVKDSEILKLKISTESYSASDSKDSPHVPKITIKPVTRTDNETRTPKKSSAVCDSPEHIPIVTKLNIKPILKPMDNAESSEGFDNKVPVVSKLNIKPVIKPKDNDVDSSVDDVPKITKLNIKPLKNPEEKSSEEKDCDGLKADIDNSIPVVTKLNIKPIVKPKEDEETHKDSENQSSETGNSSDENSDHIPVVTKLNIKPIVKPDHFEDTSKVITSDVVLDTIPVVTKLNIKPLIKPGDNASPSSPKKERSGHHSPSIPVVTKLNIKPVVRPEDGDLSKSKDEIDDKALKNPPLVMKINMKTVSENLNNEGLHNEHVSNNIEGLLTIAPKIINKVNESEHRSETKISKESKNNDAVPQTDHTSSEKPKHNCVPESIKGKEENVDKISVANKTNVNKSKSNDDPIESQQSVPKGEHAPTKTTPDDSTSKNIKISEADEIHTNQDHKKANLKAADTNADCNITQIPAMTKISPVQNCTLLKKLLENTREPTNKMPEISQTVNCTQSPLSVCKNIVNSDHSVEPDNLQSEKVKTGSSTQNMEEKSNASLKDINNTNKQETEKSKSMQELCEKTNENIMKPLEISISDKIINQNSGQDSPRIILKINKTDHGSSAKIITEEIKRSDTPQNLIENTQDIVNDKPSPKKHLLNSRKKQAADTSVNLSTGKRLRSSRIVENSEKSPMVRRNVGKRPSTTTDSSPPQSKEPDVSILQSKRLKLGQLLSSNKSLNITPVTSPTSPTKTSIDLKQGAKTVNHPLLNNENCSKNGNSKLHNILSNLQAKQLQVLPFNNTNCSEKPTVATDIECNASMNSSDAVDLSVDNLHPEINEMIINENSEFRDSSAPEEISQDPLEVDSLKSLQDPLVNSDIPKPVEMTPQPKKRGRPRKLPVSEGAVPVPVPVPLPVPALEERPQRSLRLMRDRPAILQKPRGGRGRGRGGRRAGTASPAEPEPEPSTPAALEPAHEEPFTEPPPDIDPTSSRIKLPRMTEALDKMPSSSACSTPLSSRRRQSSGTFSSSDAPELKVAFETPSSKSEDSNKSPEASSSAKGRGSRGGRGGRGRTPRGRGRGRGGGRGAMYMKETLGIYGRVCGPATTTVQLFEEETCMMDDNATPAKPSHLLDEDSQSSVKSSTNESSKMKKSKFADLFDSNKVWTAADVKEYTWPPPEKADEELKVMMIQEQVAMFLNVKSFKRRYPELKRRTIGGEERDYVLSKGLVTEALCDLGITAVDASEVLDIMLSDYPHKYEEFRSHQHQKQLMEAEEPVVEVKPEDKVRVEMKTEKPVEQKPELPKVDPEKTRQDMAAAAIASASEWNARANALRRGACADLQSLTVQRPRPVPTGPVPIHIRPPAGFYPHALLPGQYQHTYRVYTPDQLRYFPLNTVLGAAPAPAAAPAWSSDSEPDWGYSDCSDDSEPHTHAAKRKKLTKTKRSSQAEVPGTSKEESKTEEVDLCRVCKLRLEANRRYTHERFLVCANCNAKLHPSCLELNADTIRKCREYPWQCAECKTCCSCRQPADDDKMLFCDLCDRGFHIYCVGLDTVPSGRWHCVECAVCKSCGARSAWGPGGAAGAAGAAGAGEAEWHHHTKRGPGGHKVYSHSLCTPCARAYRIGRYCPLCDRSFIGPKGTMQLVICKLCDRQLHQDCVRSTGAAPRVLDYTCAECRRGGITSRAAAVRLAPRTIATLFMAKRRFNKYAHRQYLASRQAARLAELDAAPDERPDSPSDQSEPDAPDAPDAEP